jgi:hypothetical protein
MNASTAAPVRKVWSGALGGAATTLIIWLVSTFAHTNIPDPVAAALTVSSKLNSRSPIVSMFVG